jgi:soluble lytic murein transglycosylase-like protein
MANPNSKEWTLYDQLFQKSGYENQINPAWLKAICITESDLGQDPRVKQGETSRDGKSWGVMQLTLPTAQDVAKAVVTPADLNNPELSIRLAAKYLHSLVLMFDGDLRKVVMSYNQGPGNTRRGKTVNEYWEKFKRNLELIEKSDPAFTRT